MTLMMMLMIFDLMIPTILHCIVIVLFLTDTSRIDYSHPPLLLLNSALRVTQRYTPLQSDSIPAFNMAVYLSF
jgi:hypothetical protein